MKYIPLILSVIVGIIGGICASYDLKSYLAGLIIGIIIFFYSLSEFNYR